MGSSIEVKSFSSSNEVNTPPNARVEAVVVGGRRLMRLTLAPGWHWATDVPRGRHRSVSGQPPWRDHFRSRGGRP